MRNRFLLGMMALSLIGMTSCKDEIDQFDDHGSSTIVSFAGTEKAYMGDSITFDFEVKSGGVKINQAKVQLYYGEEMVSEAFYSLKADGKYSGKVLAPYQKNTPDGEAKVILRIQNVIVSVCFSIPFPAPVYNRSFGQFLSGSSAQTSRTICPVRGSQTSAHSPLNRVWALAICRAITAHSAPVGEHSRTSAAKGCGDPPRTGRA